MKPRLTTTLARRLTAAALACACALAVPVGAQAQGGLTAAQTASIQKELQEVLDRSLQGFNRGDFEGYLSDLWPRVTYNGLIVQKSRLLDINKELKQSFPELSMRYRRVRIQPQGADEAAATTVAEFTGKTNNYQGYGLPATYREEGQVRATYQKVNGKWLAHQLNVAWNDSYIDVGREFATMGFSTLPTLVGADQSYNMRLYVGNASTPGVAVVYAYALAPLSAMIEKDGAEEIFKGLKFRPVGTQGVNAELRSPAKPGTYAHILVMNKFWRQGQEEMILGQKIYTRLVRVE